MAAGLHHGHRDDGTSPLVECVVNVSEGRDGSLLNRLADAAGPAFVDLHRDPDHHRSVFTLAGAPDSVSEGARRLARAALGAIDLRDHAGVHPRFGVLDVVPFVPFEPGAPPPQNLSGVVVLRDEFARWLGRDMAIPTYRYGPLEGPTVSGGRTLPEIRRLIKEAGSADLAPDFGPPRPDPRTGISAVGARGVLVAYNVWVSSLSVARRVAPLVRSPAVRALGVAVGRRAQVSCNLVDPSSLGPADLYDAVSALVAEAGGTVEGAELVGLIPQTVLSAVPARRWIELGLSADSTLEVRLGAR